MREMKKKMVRSLTIASMTIASLTIISFSRSSSAATDLQQIAQLSDQQVQVLQALGMPIAAPGYLPPGFTLDFVQVKVGLRRIGGLNYLLVYRQYDAAAGGYYCFAIEATNGGIGSLPSGEQSYPVNNSNFSLNGTLDYGLYGEASEPTLLGNWLGLETGPFYRFVGAGVLPELARCRNIDVQEAVKISESLQLLNPSNREVNR